MSLAPDEEVRQPSYLQAFLFGSENVHFSLGAAAAAVALSFPFGSAGLLFVGGLYVTCELLGMLFIPDMPSFRSRVDRKFIDAQRQAQTDALMTQVLAFGNNPTASARMKVYRRMSQRADALERMVRSGTCSLKGEDIRRLRDACRDYLQRWLACETVKERQQNVQTGDIQRKLDDVTRLLKGTEVDADRRQLTAAHDEYTQLLQRQQRLQSRLVAIEASLESMPDAIEEVFQHAVSMPMASDSSERLQDAVDRLRIEEDLDADIRAELGSIGAARLQSSGTSARAAAAAARQLPQGH
ncbi:MAG TPA: hypothetical protein VGM15_11045 [Burkholderiaceae bacterium]